MQILNNLISSQTNIKETIYTKILLYITAPYKYNKYFLQYAVCAHTHTHTTMSFYIQNSHKSFKKLQLFNLI